MKIGDSLTNLQNLIPKMTLFLAVPTQRSCGPHLPSRVRKSEENIAIAIQVSDIHSPSIKKYITTLIFPIQPELQPSPPEYPRGLSPLRRGSNLEISSLSEA